MLDDNVQAWKAVGMGEQDSTFAKMPYPFECSKKGVTGKKRDIPLCEVHAAPPLIACADCIAPAHCDPCSSVTP